MAKNRVQVQGVKAPELQSSIGAIGNTFVQPQRNNRQQQIASAFSQVAPQISSFADRSMAEQTEADLANAEGLYLQMKQEQADGTVKSVQESGLFQEQSKTVQTRINQLRGIDAARVARAEVQEALREDPSLRKDEVKQQELFDSFMPEPSDDLVFNSSFMKTFGNHLEAERNISRQYRDSEYIREQTEGLGILAQEHADSFTAEDGTVDVAGLRLALEGEDKAGLEMGGLSPKQNKIAITDSLIQRATETSNVNVLNAIPELYKTPALKAKIVQAERAIESRLDSEATARRTKAERDRADAYRSGSQDIVRAAVDGNLNPEDYRDSEDTRLFELAVKYTTATIIPPVQSVRNSQRLQQDIENFVRSDGKVSIEGFPDSIDKDDILDLVMADKSINPTEAMRIMNSIDSILKVDELQSDRTYKSGTVDLKSSISAASNLPWIPLADLKGRDWKGELRNVWEDTVADHYQEYLQANGGQEPTKSEINSFIQLGEQAYEKRLRSLTNEYSGAKSEANSIPAVGTVKNGYTFTGGNPNDSSNWEQI